MKKRGEPPVDGLGPKDIERLIKASRKCWTWSGPWRLVRARCLNTEGFSVCEGCLRVVPKIQVDHIVPCGSWDAGYIDRLFCPSSGLRALCSSCHRKITNEGNHERRQRAKKLKNKK